MSTLYEVVLQKKQAGSQITANPTLEAMNGEHCKILDALVPSDGYIADRVAKTLDELDRAGGIDYNDHYRNAFDAYNEAVCYQMMKYERGFNVKPIPEQAGPTPDFAVEFTSHNYKGEDVTDVAFVEVKSLSFGGGNLQYKQVQQDSLESNIELEEQRKRGKRICSSFYEVSPLGHKGNGLTFEIEELNKKINNNIKPGQYQFGNGNDTFLFVDLSQFIFPFAMEECLPVYPDLRHKYSTSGRLWMIAFGEEGDRVFSNCEFEEKEILTRNCLCRVFLSLILISKVLYLAQVLSLARNAFMVFTERRSKTCHKWHLCINFANFAMMTRTAMASSISIR